MLTISQLRLTVYYCVCVSEVVKHGLGDEEREGTCSKCMVISAEEVMESGHFFMVHETSHLSLYNYRTCVL